MAEIFDLIIVGGGIIGANVFYSTTQKYPEWKIMLVDRNQVGSGVSFYSAGINVPIGKNPWHADLSNRSQAIYSSYLNTLPCFPIEKISTAWVVSSNEREKFKNQVNQKKLSKLSNISSKDEMIAKIKVASDETMLVQNENMVGDVHAITKYLIEKSIKTNFISEGFNVNKIVRNRYGIYSVYSDKNFELQSNRIIYCTGPWYNKRSSHFETQRLKKIVALHIGVKPQPNDSIIFFYASGNFIVPMHKKGYWLLSITSNDWDINPAKLTISFDEIQYANLFLKKYIPSLAHNITGGRVFFDGYTSDRIPIISPCSNDGSSFAIYGCSGSGYRLAPALAETAISLMK